MDETPFREGSEPQNPPLPDGGQPAPYAPYAPTPRRGGRRRWLWLLGVGGAVAVILALGFAAGLAMANASAAGGSPAGLFQQRAPHGGPGRGDSSWARGAFGLTVTKVSGQTITATGRGGKSVTIHVTASTTYTRAGKSVSLSAITSGEQIAVMGKRNSDGSVAASRITVLLPGYHGAVTAVSGSTITISDRQTTHVIHVSGATSYTTDGNVASSLSAVVKGVTVEAMGTKNADGSLNAEAVEIEYPRLSGKVTTVTATSITISGPRGTQVIHVNASTTYASVTLGANGPAKAAASLGAVKAGVFVLAEGLLNSDGSLNARSVTILPAPRSAPWSAPGGGPNGGPPGAAGTAD